MKKIVVPVVLISLILIFATVISAAPVDQDGAGSELVPDAPRVAATHIKTSEITWFPQVKNAGLVLTVSGPNGLYLRQNFDGDTAVTLDLLLAEGNVLPDGSYTYEIVATPILSQDVRDAMVAARASGDDTAITQLRNRGAIPQEAMIQSGYFTVKDSAFVTANVRGEEELTATTAEGSVTNGGPVPLDQVILDDLIVDGSACVGFDCVNGESFGFDTIRLKENNLRIKFQDTSTTASFPTNDWQLTANDTANGGANKFSIDDVDGGRTPFTIEASAPSHSLYVDDGGRVGLGTSTPVVEIHVKDGDTPTMRLEQDGSSGFTPQTWDVAGNETNFFVRDATNGSKLPFRIRPSAPSNSLYIDTDGDVGLGTSSPAAALEVERSNATAQILVDENSSTNADRTLLKLENNGPVKTQFYNSGQDIGWTYGMDASNNFIIGLDVFGFTTPILTINQNGDVTATGTITGSSRRSPEQDKLIAEQQTQINELEARIAELEALVQALADANE